MKRKKNQNAPADDKHSNNGFTIIQNGQQLLDKVSRVKSQHKEEQLRSDELDFIPVRLVKSKSSPQQVSKKNNKDRKDASKEANTKLPAIPATQIPPSSFVKYKSGKDKTHLVKVEKPVIVKHEKINNQSMCASGLSEPGSNKGYNNVGFSSIVYKDVKETRLSGHILKGVDIFPNEDKIRKSSHLNNQKVVDHFYQEEEQIDLAPKIVPQNENEKSESSEVVDDKPMAHVERFSWDKLHDSISLAISEEDLLGPVRVRTKAEIEQNKTPNDSSSRKVSDKYVNKPSPKPTSGSSSNDGYSMDFDDETEDAQFNKESENQKIIVKIDEHIDTSSENQSQITTPTEATPKVNDQPDDAILAVDVEELSHADNIMHQVYNKLPLSLDSACSTISDRLSTIPEDPRSHEDGVLHNMALENILSQKAASKQSHPPTSNELEDDSRSRLEEEEDVIRPFNSQGMDITEKNLESQRSEIQDCNLQEENKASYKAFEEVDGKTEMSLSEGPLSDVNNLGGSSPNTSVDMVIRTQVDEEKNLIERKPSHSLTQESSEVELVNSDTDKKTKAQNEKELENSKPSKPISKMSSNSVSFASNYNPTDSSQTSSIHGYITSSSDDLKDVQSSKIISEISNISEGQVVNCILLSEGELSQTLKSEEEVVLQPDAPKDYLADESNISSDINPEGVPNLKMFRKSTTDATKNLMSNKTRSMKSKLERSVGSEAIAIARENEKEGAVDIKNLDTKSSVSEGELSTD